METRLSSVILFRKIAVFFQTSVFHNFVYMSLGDGVHPLDHRIGSLEVVCRMDVHGRC